MSLEDFDREDIYVDLAACTSPWAQILREKLGIKSYAIDADLSERYRHLDYYMRENATKTSFPDSSVRGLSLQCAYEMFIGNDDIELLKEIKRILRPGGKAVIVPLYMHTHYCSFSSPEYWGKGYSDKEAKEYVNMGDRGTPSARFYDVAKLQERVLDNIAGLGMTYKLHVLRNKEAISPEVYCHFVLEVVK